MILLPVSELLNSPDRRWYDIANEMVFEAEEKLNLLDLFGERKYMNKAISGYSVGYTYGHHDFFFTVCYHHIWARMGVLIKFSAQALAYYQGQTNLRYEKQSRDYIIQKCEHKKYRAIKEFNSFTENVGNSYHTL